MTTNSAGVMGIVVPIPAVPALVGQRVFVQPIVATPGGVALGVADLGAVSALIVGN